LVSNAADVEIDHETVTGPAVSGVARVQRTTESGAGSPEATPWRKRVAAVVGRQAPAPARRARTEPQLRDRDSRKFFTPIRYAGGVTISSAAR